MTRTNSSTAELSIVFYDGECGLCSRSVSFILKYDTDRHFHFLSLQSETADSLLKGHGIRDIQFDTLYLQMNGHLYNRSEAVRKILGTLNAKRFLLFSWALRCIPKPIRDYTYSIISKNRKRLFKKHHCLILSKEEQSQIIQ